MAISIEGIKITQAAIVEKEGEMEIQGTYALMGSNGIVLAKQSFNGYNDMKLNLSPDGKKKFHDFMGVLKSELSASLGM